MTKQLYIHFAVSSALLGLLLSAPLSQSQVVARCLCSRAASSDGQTAIPKVETSSPPAYNYTLLSIPDALTSYLVGINLGATTNKIEVVGSGPAGGTLAQVSGQKTVVEAYQVVNNPTGETNQQAAGVNDTGAIVGGYIDSSNVWHGYERSGASFIPIDVPFAGAMGTFPFGINNSGEVVGTWTKTANGDDFHGFALVGSTYTALAYPGADYTAPTAINSKGDVVGEYGAAGVTHGFLLSGGAYTSLDPPKSVTTFPFGINDAGNIVGSYCETKECEDTYQGLKGFVLRGGVFTKFEIPGEFYTFLNGINNNGLIVGYYQDAAGLIVSFLATPNP